MRADVSAADNSNSARDSCRRLETRFPRGPVQTKLCPLTEVHNPTVHHHCDRINTLHNCVATDAAAFLIVRAAKHVSFEYWPIHISLGSSIR